jgi:hypothetical protein
MERVTDPRIASWIPGFMASLLNLVFHLHLGGQS